MPNNPKFDWLRIVLFVVFLVSVPGYYSQQDVAMPLVSVALPVYQGWICLDTDIVGTRFRFQEGLALFFGPCVFEILQTHADTFLDQNNTEELLSYMLIFVCFVATNKRTNTQEFSQLPHITALAGNQEIWNFQHIWMLCFIPLGLQVYCMFYVRRLMPDQNPVLEIFVIQGSFLLYVSVILQNALDHRPTYLLLKRNPPQLIECKALDEASRQRSNNQEFIAQTQANIWLAQDTLRHDPIKPNPQDTRCVLGQNHTMWNDGHNRQRWRLPMLVFALFWAACVTLFYMNRFGQWGILSRRHSNLIVGLVVYQVFLVTERLVSRREFVSTKEKVSTVIIVVCFLAVLALDTMFLNDWEQRVYLGFNQLLESVGSTICSLYPSWLCQNVKIQQANIVENCEPRPDFFALMHAIISLIAMICERGLFYMFNNISASSGPISVILEYFMIEPQEIFSCFKKYQWIPSTVMLLANFLYMPRPDRMAAIRN